MEEQRSHSVNLDSLKERLRQFFGVEPFMVEPLEGGTNNHLQKITMADGKKYVLKCYFQDGRRRLEREYDLLTVLREKRIENIPTHIARFDDLYAALYTFIEGKSLTSFEFSHHELASVAAYLNRLQSIKPDEVKTPLENGFTSAFSLKEIIDLIFGRMSSFQGDVIAGLDPRIIAFTRETQVLSRVERAMEVCKETFSVRLNHQLPVEDRRLSSVDCGPHNMLWRADGSLVVLDFEYGGWDHPLRVIGDMLAGDKMHGLTEAKKTYFIEQYLAGSSLSQAVLVDLGAFLAFSDIEWIMIYMTSLLPAKLARLQHAKGPSYDMDAYLSQQMEKIREKLDRLGPA